jgi:TM2 domain-containing membrane protein YozV
MYTPFIGALKRCLAECGRTLLFVTVWSITIFIVCVIISGVAASVDRAKSVDTAKVE